MKNLMLLITVKLLMFISENIFAQEKENDNKSIMFAEKHYETYSDSYHHLYDYKKDISWWERNKDNVIVASFLTSAAITMYGIIYGIRNYNNGERPKLCAGCKQNPGWEPDTEPLNPRS